MDGRIGLLWYLLWSVNDIIVFSNYLPHEGHMKQLFYMLSYLENSQIFSNWWFSIVINSILLWHWLRLKTLSTIGLNILIETSSFSAVSVARGDGHSLQLYKLIAMVWFVSTSTNKTSFLLMIIVVVIFSSSVKHYKVWLAMIYIESVESFKIYCNMALHSVKFRANLVLLIFHSGNFLHEKSPFF